MSDAITIDPETMHGVPVFRGTLVPVQTMFDYLEGGDPLEDFLSGFPTGFPRPGTGRAGRSPIAVGGPLLMRLLLDECIDERLPLYFPNHDCQPTASPNFPG